MDGEFYLKDGLSYDRPTHILDYFAPPGLVEWKIRVGNREANRISKIALRHGKDIDELIRSGKEPKKSESLEVKNCYKAWLKWKEDYSPKRLLFPETGYCNSRMIAGTPDIYWEDALTLIDIKSSKAIHENYFFQLGCYASLLPCRIETLAVLRLDKELGEYEFVTNKKVNLSINDCIAAFDGLLSYYRRYKRVQSTLEPKEKVYDECD